MEAPERTLKLSETSNLLRRIAAAMIRAHGEYRCTVDGERVRVIADGPEVSR